MVGGIFANSRKSSNGGVKTPRSLRSNGPDSRGLTAGIIKLLGAGLIEDCGASCRFGGSSEPPTVHLNCGVWGGVISLTEISPRSYE